MFNFDLNWINVSATVLDKIFNPKKPPKSIKIATYTLNDTGILALTELHNSGIHVECVCGNYLAAPHTNELPFRVYQNRKNHAKLFILDNNAWVGSTNLVSDTMINILTKLTKTQTEQAKLLFTQIKNNTIESETVIL